VIFSVTAIPEIVPYFSPALKTGEVTIDVVSSSTVEGFEGDRIYLVVSDVEFHRVGVSGGTWVKTLHEPRQVELVEAGRHPEALGDARISIGEYDFARVSLAAGSFESAGSGIALKITSNSTLTPVNFVVTENLLVALVLDVTFDESALTAIGRFDPYLSMVVKEEPVYEPTMSSLKLIASFGPVTRSPGSSSSFVFGIAPGEEVENYLLYAKGGTSGEEAFEVEVLETGDLWYGISGEAWFLGGNLTVGSYNVMVRVSESSAQPVTLLLKMFTIPGIGVDVSRVGFYGSSYVEPFIAPPMNEVGIYFDKAGLYKIYLAVQGGDYGFLADSNPIAFVASNRTVALELSEGFHSFQILPDYSGSGRDTSWTITVTRVPTASQASLSPAAALGTLLLAVAVSVTILNYFLTRIAARRIERSSSRLLESRSS